MSDPTTVCSNWSCVAPKTRELGRSYGALRRCRRAFTGAISLPRSLDSSLAANTLRLSRRALEIGRHDDWPDDLPEIVYVDRYGNALTGLRGSLLPMEARLAVSGRVLNHARTFSDVPAGEAFWYENSNGLVEIAVNGGRAADALHLVIGSPVAVLR